MLRSMSTQLDLKRFLATTEPADLGPGPRSGVQSQAALSEQLGPLLKTSGLARERQELIRALILLWHDHLDAAHPIAQNIEGVDGAFVHGIMHRREPDFGNAAYWFRRVGRHPAYAEIGARVTALVSSGTSELAARLIPKGGWDPFAFIAACAEVSNGLKTNQSLLREIQKLESSALLGTLGS